MDETTPGAASAALASALDSLTLRAEDGAAVELARQYATAIDADGDLVKLGPPLLAALESLGMTPRARAALAKKAGNATNVDVNPLDDMLGRRRAGKRDAPAVDPTAS